MSRYESIYRDQADDYDALVGAEDAEGNLKALLHELIGDAHGKTALELGMGTGRVTRWLLQSGIHVRGYEAAPAMLEVAQKRLAAEGFNTQDFYVGDAYRDDFGEGWADLAIAGWVFGHAVSWHSDDWADRIDRAVGSMKKALVPGGRILIIETLGTGFTMPTAPPALEPYYLRLERVHGLVRHAVRTDYAFASEAEAERLVRFFFGDAMGDRVKSEGGRVVPECTGVWSNRT